MDASIKAARLADQIRDYLALWSAQDNPGFIFSLTDVTLSKDLGRATIWVQITGEKRQIDSLLERLNRTATAYQRKLYRALNKYKAPQITFKLDTGSELDEHFQSLLNG